MKHLLKDKKISVWKLTTKKVNGVNTSYYEAIGRNIWAHYQMLQNGGATLTEQNNLTVWDSTERAQFVINYRDDVQPSPGDLLVFRNKFYDIIVTDDFEGRREHLKITVALADSQDASYYTGKGVEL